MCGYYIEKEENDIGFHPLDEIKANLSLIFKS